MTRTAAFRILIILAGVMGADGVMLAAAAAHQPDATRLASASVSVAPPRSVPRRATASTGVVPGVPVEGAPTGQAVITMQAPGEVTPSRVLRPATPATTPAPKQ